MKKTLSVITCLVLVLSIALVGCGGPKVDSMQSIVDELQEDLSAMKSALGDTMDIDITANGSTLIYTFSYLTDIGDPAAIKDDLAVATEQQSSVYEELVTTLKDAGINSPSVVIEYLDMNGDEIYSKEFK